jgi:hypothetical protein
VAPTTGEPVTVLVPVTLAPATAVIVSLSVAELLPGVGSVTLPGAVTVAVLLSVPARPAREPGRRRGRRADLRNSAAPRPQSSKARRRSRPPSPACSPADLALLETLAHQCDGMRRIRRGLHRRESTAQPRIDTEHRKIIRRDERGPDLLSPIPHSDRHLHREETGQPGEVPDPISKIDQVWIRGRGGDLSLPGCRILESQTPERAGISDSIRRLKEEPVQSRSRGVLTPIPRARHRTEPSSVRSPFRLRRARRRSRRKVSGPYPSGRPRAASVPHGCPARDAWSRDR